VILLGTVFKSRRVEKVRRMLSPAGALVFLVKSERLRLYAPTRAFNSCITGALSSCSLSLQERKLEIKNVSNEADNSIFKRIRALFLKKVSG
jgi:hypothetical protein